MLCPKCNKASTKREREGGKCPQCGRLFRLSPTDAQDVSDYEFEKAVAQLTQKGAHKFTRSQLVAEIDRHLVHHNQKWIDTLLHAVTPNTAVPWVLVVLLAGMGIASFLLELLAAGVIALVIAALIAWYAFVRETPEEETAKLEAQRELTDPRATRLVSTYLAGEPLPGLLPDERWLAREQHRDQREFDLHSFGFDRVVVVEGDEMVEMLIANRFHFEHNAAIVSFTGYPRHVAEIVAEQMKRGHTRAHVLLLHDASVRGYQRAETWRQSGWAQSASITRVGLTPRQVSKVVPVKAGAAGELPAWVSPDDAAWLHARSVPLAALRPAQIMTLLFNAMTELDKRDQRDGSADVVVGFDTVSDSSYDFG